MNIRSRNARSSKLLVLLTIVALATLVMVLAAAPSAFAYDGEELAFLTLINNYRASYGLPALTMSDSLYNASENHSWDMATYNYFSHTGRNGSSPWDRIRAAGYTYNTYLGENIAAGYVDAQSVFVGWRNSPGHNANMLNANYRAIGIGRAYGSGSTYGWYWTTDFGGVSEDNTPPSVSIPTPTGSSKVSGTVIFSANASDNVAISQVDLYIDGILVANDTTAPYSVNWDTTQYSQGSHALFARAFDTSGFYTDASISITVENFSPAKNYYFTWYDQSNGDWRDWVLMANPAGGRSTARASALVGGVTYADRDLPVGSPAETPAFPGVIGGPVKVSTTQPLITSQRVIYKNSFNEIPAVPDNTLETAYYFTWYDSNLAGGVKGDWILIGNQGTTDAIVDVYIAGVRKGTYSIPVGGRVTPSYPNTTDGPVKVVSTNLQPLIVSQRVLYRDSFNEVLGVPESKLSSEYAFTWYDNKPENSMRGNWVIIGNMDTGDAAVEVYIGGVLMGSYLVPEGSRATPSYPDAMDGPVRVVSTNGKKLIVSQRMLFKDSFEEFQGLTPTDSGTDLWFTWYDSKAVNGMNGNWIMVTNQGSVDANVDIYLGGTLTEQVVLAPGENRPFSYFNTMAGPVRIVSTNSQPLFVTQRVLYLNSFNEISGMRL
ncbi:MAG: CAP domain-containing protein [Thermoleophilia bacterium]